MQEEEGASKQPSRALKKDTKECSDNRKGKTQLFCEQNIKHGTLQKIIHLWPFYLLCLKSLFFLKQVTKVGLRQTFPLISLNADNRNDWSTTSQASAQEARRHLTSADTYLFTNVLLQLAFIQFKTFGTNNVFTIFAVVDKCSSKKE